MDAHERHRTRTLWLTGVLHAFTHMYQVALMPLYLLIQRDFKFASVGQATLLLTVMMAACFGPSYPIGVLADKMNRKKLLGFGLALNGVGFVALALGPNYAWALVAWARSGVGGSFYHPAKCRVSSAGDRACCSFRQHRPHFSRSLRNRSRIGSLHQAERRIRLCDRKSVV